MKPKLGDMTGAAIDDEAGDVEEMAEAADVDNDNDGADESAPHGEGGNGAGGNAAAGGAATGAGQEQQNVGG